MSRIARLRNADPSDAASMLRQLTPDQREQLMFLWDEWARPEQLAPSWDWVVWLIKCGRGWGKTRVGAEQVREWVKTNPLVNLIGATADDARDIMIQGESGILAVCPRWERPRYVKNERKLKWPNGAESLIFTADEPDRMRGKQHMKLWCDELAAWRYPETWTQALFGLRLGRKPQAIVTTTPRPTAIIKELVKDPTTHVTNGATKDNAANLASVFIQKITAKYEGTRLGRQELSGEILDDNPNGLFQHTWIDNYRITFKEFAEHVTPIRWAVAIDPSVSAKEDSDLCGIVAGCISPGLDGRMHLYVTDDESLVATPRAWARTAVALYHRRRADRIVAEINNGGDLVQEVLRAVDTNIAYRCVHATRGKVIRAEPVSALYEQGRVHHVGSFAKLEDEQCDYDPINSSKSPDRMDALVWLAYELMIGPQGSDYSILGGR